LRILADPEARFGLGHLLAQGLEVQHFPFQHIDENNSFRRMFGRSRARRFTHFIPILFCFFFPRAGGATIIYGKAICKNLIDAASPFTVSMDHAKNPR
jgi:hypothetical protein